MMIIKNVSYDDLVVALDKVNSKFDNNVKFKKVESANKDGNRWVVTLGITDSHEAGGRRSSSGRRVAAACWHVHGEFLDALPSCAQFKSAHMREWRQPGEEWENFNLGSRYRPFYASAACDC